MKKLLFIDDDKLFQEKIKDELRNTDWDLSVASDSEEALRLLKEHQFPIILLDLILPDADGLNLIPQFKQISPDSLIIVQTAYPTIDRAIRAIKEGAYDFFIKPYSNNITYVLDRAYSLWKSKKENFLLSNELRVRISELEKYADRLNKERNKILTLLKEIKEGVIVINEENKIYLINDVAMEIFQVNYDKKTKKFYCSSPNFKRLLENMIKVKEERLSSLSLQFKIGKKHPKYYNVSIKLLSDKNSAEVIAIINDVSEIIELHEMRSTFISKLSHELRTPLSIIKGSIDILEKKLSCEDQSLAGYLKIINEQINHLNNKITQLLSFSEFYTGNVTINREMNSIIKVLKAESNILMEKFQSKGINFSMQLPTEIPDFLFDYEKISLALRSYLENAYKFSPEGGSIFISAKVINHLSEIEEIIPPKITYKLSGEILIICIKDEGPGIESQEREIIFEPFFQSETIYEHSNGMGLGLYIAKSIIEAHGGITWVQNGKPTGSIFYILLPLIGNQISELSPALFKITL